MKNWVQVSMPTVVLSFKNLQATSWNEKNMGATPFHSIEREKQTIEKKWTLACSTFPH